MTECACGNCQFFDSHGAKALKAANGGLCRYNPPISQPSAKDHGLWPVVEAKDWCGHFHARVDRFMTAAE
jgi:hypothetical protein